MKLETLKKNNLKKGFLIVSIFLVIVLAIVLNITKAKYKVTTNAKLVQDTIDYKLPDLTVLGIYVKDKGETDYRYVEEVPEGSYTVNESMSYCLKKGSNDKITDAIKYDENGLYIGIDERGTRCKVYLDGKATAKDTLADLYKDGSLTVTEDASKCPEVDQSTGQAKSGITSPSTEPGTLLCKGYDDDGETYYFRGTAEKNWVLIDKTYWRIVRINGNGSIRLIYSGKGSAAVSGTGTMIATGITFNDSYNDNAYVGYMYGKPQTKGTGDDEAYKATHANSTNSNILKQIVTWYNGAEFPTTVKQYIDEDAGFCGDRTPYASGSGGNINKKEYGWGSSYTYYGGYVRIYTDKRPSFKCPQTEDLYTSANSSKGNHSLPVPVGLITADEVMFAGSGYGSSYSNSTYYLYTGQYYWTMSPYCAADAQVFSVDSTGYLNRWRVTGTNIGVRPVINLKAGTPFKSDTSADGSKGNPFVVSLQ